MWSERLQCFKPCYPVLGAFTSVLFFTLWSVLPPGAFISVVSCWQHLWASHHPLVLWPLLMPDGHPTWTCSCWPRCVPREHSVRWADVSVVVANTAPTCKAGFGNENVPKCICYFGIIFWQFPLSPYWLTFVSNLPGCYMLSLTMYSKNITSSFQIW